MPIKDSQHSRGSISIALRMTVWYALSAFTLVFVTTGLLYWVLVGSLYDEDIRDLADYLVNAQMLLGPSPTDLQLRSAVRPHWAPPHQTEIYLRVLDRQGHILAETQDMASELPPPTKADLAAISILDGRKQEVVSRTGKRFLTLTVHASEEAPDRFLQIALDHEHDRYLLARYRERSWLALSIALIVSSLIGYLIARSGMRPIERIAQTAERIHSSTLHERIDPAGLPAELSGLADTFNSMLNRLEDSFRRVSQFSDDVAHELRTPVNNLRGEIEVALNKARTGEDYREILGSCLEECGRISRLIQSLLFLARTESASEPPKGDNLDVSKELVTVQEFYGAAAAEAGVALRLSASDGLSLEMDRALLQQAIGNLVSNAIAHTKSGGYVEIVAGADSNQLIITVIDSGCGIAAEHLPRVFDRFYRVDPARTNSGQNVGLGLAVVKGIVERYGGHVEIKSELGQGTEVRLLLPPARKEPEPI